MDNLGFDARAGDPIRRTLDNIHFPPSRSRLGKSLKRNRADSKTSPCSSSDFVNNHYRGRYSIEIIMCTSRSAIQRSDTAIGSGIQGYLRGGKVEDRSRHIVSRPRWNGRFLSPAQWSIQSTTHWYLPAILSAVRSQIHHADGAKAASPGQAMRETSPGNMGKEIKDIDRERSGRL